MGIFDFLKKPKSDVEKYYEEREELEAEKRVTAQMDLSYSADFRITVQDVFSITGRGTVITGQIERGSVSVGDEVTLHRKDGRCIKTKVKGIEMFRKMLSTAHSGDKVGIFLGGLERDEAGKGDVLEK